MGRFMTRSQRSEAYGNANKKFTNVFVKNFGELVDDEQLRLMFVNFGEITSAVVAKGEDGKSKGHGFINFKDSSSAENAVENMHDSECNGKRSLNSLKQFAFWMWVVGPQKL